MQDILDNEFKSQTNIVPFGEQKGCHFASAFKNDIKLNPLKMEISFYLNLQSQWPWLNLDELQNCPTKQN